MAEFLQRVAGYCLTGDVREHALFFVHGPGGSGKSTFIEMLKQIMGSYAWSAPMEAFLSSYNSRHPTDIAGLCGRRMVTATETEQHRHWNESRIKELTGDDTITARFMRQDYFEFSPSHKLVLIGNHAPSLRSTGSEMRRRFHIIPFDCQPKERDTYLKDKLRDEREAILSWMIQGAVKWHQQGLQPPQTIIQATEAYFECEDAFGNWLETNVLQAGGERDTTVRLYDSYAKHLGELGEQPVTQKQFGAELKRRGFRSTRFRDVTHKQWRGWSGLRVE